MIFSFDVPKVFHKDNYIFANCRVIERIVLDKSANTLFQYGIPKSPLRKAVAKKWRTLFIWKDVRSVKKLDPFSICSWSCNPKFWSDKAKLSTQIMNTV